MKNYKVNVNGTEYAISIELMNETEAAAAKKAAQAAPAAAPAASAAAGEGAQVVAPMQGTILSVNVKSGDAVKKGQVLGIVEAMKLMNEIESEYDGVVEEIMVGNEEVVEYGQPLFRIH